MKNTKKNIKTIGAAALLLSIVLVPNTSAIMLEGETMKTTIENDDNEPLCFGSISGMTKYYKGWGGPYPLPFALVEVRINNTLIGKDRSSIRPCLYRIGGLSIGKTYTVTCSHKGFAPETVTVTLTAEKPNAYYVFGLYYRPTDPSEDNSKQVSLKIDNHILPNRDYFPIISKIISSNFFL